MNKTEAVDGALTRKSLERIFDEVVYRSLRPLALGLGIYYGFLVPAHLYSLPTEAGRVMAAVAGVSSAVYLGLLVWFTRRPHPPSWAQPIEHGMAAIVLANTLIHRPRATPIGAAKG